MAYIRYECAAEGFEHNWAEISDRWTRRQILALHESEEDAIAVLQDKIGACHIETADGVISKGSDLSIDAILDMQAEIHGFLLQLPLTVWNVRSTVGKVSGRRSLPVNGMPEANPIAT